MVGKVEERAARRARDILIAATQPAHDSPRREPDREHFDGLVPHVRHRAEGCV